MNTSRILLLGASVILLTAGSAKSDVAWKEVGEEVHDAWNVFDPVSPPKCTIKIYEGSYTQNVPLGSVKAVCDATAKKHPNCVERCIACPASAPTTAHHMAISYADVMKESNKLTKSISAKFGTSVANVENFDLAYSEQSMEKVNFEKSKDFKIELGTKDHAPSHWLWNIDAEANLVITVILTKNIHQLIPIKCWNPFGKDIVVMYYHGQHEISGDATGGIAVVDRTTQASCGCGKTASPAGGKGGGGGGAGWIPPIPSPDGPQLADLCDTSPGRKDDQSTRLGLGQLSDPVPRVTYTALKVSAGQTIVLDDPINATQTRIAVTEDSFDKYIPFIVAGTTAGAGLLLMRDTGGDKATGAPLAVTQGNKELSPADRLVFGADSSAITAVGGKSGARADAIALESNLADGTTVRNIATHRLATVLDSQGQPQQQIVRFELAQDELTALSSAVVALDPTGKELARQQLTPSASGQLAVTISPEQGPAHSPATLTICAEAAYERMARTLYGFRPDDYSIQLNYAGAPGAAGPTVLPFKPLSSIQITRGRVDGTIATTIVRAAAAAENPHSQSELREKK
jgi:hypothetical protein